MRMGIAVVAATCTLAAVGPAVGDTYVHVTDGTAWQLNGVNAPYFYARPESSVVGAAFDSSGRLWLARDSGDDSCTLTSPDAPDALISPRDLAYPGGTRFRNIRLCEPAQGPGNSLMVEGHNGSQGSAVTWQMNLDTLALRRIAYGSQPAIGPGGRFADIQHTYQSGSRVTVWDALAMGWITRPGTIRRAVPRPRSYSSPGAYWQGPSFAPDGRLAVARSGRPVVGRPGRWTAVGRSGMGAQTTAWDSAGDLFVVGNSNTSATLWRIPGGRPGSPVNMVTESEPISALAIGPDASPAVGTVPSVVGSSVSAAEATLDAAGFTLSPTQGSTDADSSPRVGTVVAQTPAAGTTASLRNPVALTVQE
jgi:PASTA domain